MARGGPRGRRARRPPDAPDARSTWRRRRRGTVPRRPGREFARAFGERGRARARPGARRRGAPARTPRRTCSGHGGGGGRAAGRSALRARRPPGRRRPAGRPPVAPNGVDVRRSTRGSSPRLSKPGGGPRRIAPGDARVATDPVRPTGRCQRSPAQRPGRAWGGPAGPASGTASAGQGRAESLGGGSSRRPRGGKRPPVRPSAGPGAVRRISAGRAPGAVIRAPVRRTRRWATRCGAVGGRSRAGEADVEPPGAARGPRAGHVAAPPAHPGPSRLAAAPAGLSSRPAGRTLAASRQRPQGLWPTVPRKARWALSLHGAPASLQP